MEYEKNKMKVKRKAKKVMTEGKGWGERHEGRKEMEEGGRKGRKKLRHGKGKRGGKR